MDMYIKPLYALRDLAKRMGIVSPTSCTKTKLIEKIEERKAEIESGTAYNIDSPFGRPRLNPCFINFELDENGKVVFTEENHPSAPAEIPPPVIQPVLELDEKSRQALLKLEDLAKTISLAVNKILELDEKNRQR